MQKYFTLLAFFLGGERTVSQAVSSLDKIVTKLAAAQEQLSQEHFKSMNKLDAAYDRYRALEEKESGKQSSIRVARDRAYRVHAKISDLLA